MDGAGAIIALMNGIMTYAAAIGINTVVTAPPPPPPPSTGQGAQQPLPRIAGGRSRRTWHTTPVPATPPSRIARCARSIRTRASTRPSTSEWSGTHLPPRTPGRYGQLLVNRAGSGGPESVARRILIGAAGHRVQGLLAKLGLTRSYVMINTYLYSVYGQSGARSTSADADIAKYRHRWLDALLVGSHIRAVLTPGIWRMRRGSGTAPHPRKALQVAYQHVTHPTQPDSASKGSEVKRKGAHGGHAPGLGTPPSTRCAGHHPAGRPGAGGALRRRLQAADLVEIPERDLPPGMPPWMRGKRGMGDPHRHRRSQASHHHDHDSKMSVVE